MNQEANGIDFETCQINALVYADDLVLIADKPDTLDKLILMLNQWCVENRMRINVDKTTIIHFRQPKKQKCEYTFTCGKDRIDYIDNYKYLGVDFTEHLSWAQLSQSTSISANRAANYLIVQARNSGALVFEVYTHLYNTLVLPIIGYSSFLWGYKTYSDVTKIQNNLMEASWVLVGMPRLLPSWVIWVGSPLQQSLRSPV